MPKIVILLFAVLVASAVNASGTKDQLDSSQNRLVSYLTTEINKVEEKYNTIKPIIREKSGIIYNTDENPIYKNAAHNVYAILSKAEEETREVMQTQNNRGSKDCHEMARSLKSKAKAFLSQVYSCTDGILNIAGERISDTRSKYERLRSSLIDRRNRIAACNRIVNIAKEVATAVSCIEAIETDTRSFIAESVPPVFAKIDETNHFISTFTSRLARCSKGYAAFRMEAAYLTRRAKICYQQKIDEATVRHSPT